jgi:CheY-like chemotaxis protein
MPTHKLFLDWLAEAGLATASAFDGATGLDLARRLRPQLILLDIRLPKMDGWQVLTALDADPGTAAIPVVIISVTDEAQPAMSHGPLQFLVKPIDRDRFLQRLRGVRPELFAPGPPARVLVVATTRRPASSWPTC